MRRAILMSALLLLSVTPSQVPVLQRVGSVSWRQRPSSTQGNHWAKGPWRPSPIDALTRETVTAFRSKSSTQLEAIRLAGLDTGKVRKLSPKEAIRVAVSATEQMRRAVVEWGEYREDPVGLSNIAWLMHEAIPDSDASRQWARLRFLVEAYALGVKKGAGLVDVATRVAERNGDADVDCAFLYEAVAVPTLLSSRHRVEASIARLEQVKPTGIYYRDIAVAYHGLYLCEGKREDLQRAIDYRRRWLELAPASARGRGPAQERLEREVKLLSGFYRGSRDE